MKMTNEFLKDFCNETNKDIKNKIITGYSISDLKNGQIRINLEDVNGLFYFIYTDVVELMSFSYQKMLSHNF